MGVFMSVVKAQVVGWIWAAEMMSILVCCLLDLQYGLAVSLIVNKLY